MRTGGCSAVRRVLLERLIGEVDLERSLDGGGARRSGNYQGGVCPQTGLV